jgi:hypothetical protein
MSRFQPNGTCFELNKKSAFAKGSAADHQENVTREHVFRDRKLHEMPPCGDRELYSLKCGRPLTNPVAFFRDFGEKLPFLVLYGFEPQNGSRCWAFGDKFHRDWRDRVEQIGWKKAA